METRELSCNDSYITQEEEVCSDLNKSELDIEIELCEDLLNSECSKRDFTEMINCDKENLSENDCSRKKHKVEVSKSRNVGTFINSLNYENESQDDFNIILLPKNCLQNCNKLNEIINNNNNVLGHESEEKDVNTLPENIEDQPLENSQPTNISEIICASEKEETSNLDDIDSTKFALDEKDSELSLLVETDDSIYEVSFLDVTNENQDTENHTLDIVPKLNLSVTENSLSTNIVKSLIETEESSSFNNHGFKNDIDTKKLDLEEKDVELSLLVDTDDSIYEVSILDVTNDEESSNKSEIILSSIKKEDQGASNDIAKVPEKSYEQIKDDEKEDLLDPRWDTIKKLTTDEERYQQVKTCWKSAKIPDPNKNLTCHSFRKRQFKDTLNQPKQRKRMASNNLNDKSTKRSRTCTYHLDNHIETVSLKKKTKANEIMLEMDREIIRVNKNFQQEVQRHFDPIRGYNSYAFGQLQARLENKIAVIRSQYSHEANHCINTGQSEINALNTARSEVLQFFKFYKGLNSRNDPTMLTTEQNVELEEIENIYSKFNNYYS